MSGGGFGRGKRFLAQLDDQSKTTLNSTKSSSENKTAVDSGFGPSGTTGSDPQRAGRGRLIQQLLQTSIGTDLPVSRGRGRAAIIETLLGQSSTSSELTFPGVSRGASRGQLLQSISRSSEVTKSAPSRASGSDSSSHGVEKLAERVSSIQVALPTPQEEVSMSTEEALQVDPVLKHGSHGRQVPVVSNYIKLIQKDPNMGVYEYEVRFCPSIDSRSVRFQLLNEHSEKFGGTKTFDGVILFLPILLPDKLTTYVSQNPADGTPIEIRIMYKRKKALQDCINLYNILFERILNTLKYVRFKRKQFDPSAPKMIPQHKLEIWPGYVTAVDEYEGGLMLCCDVSHRLICQKSALEVLQEAYRSNPSSYQETAKKALLGSVVLARYNNKTYRIDDISFDMNPMSTFKAKQSDLTYYDYYLSHHNIEIRDKRQPLLISIKQRRVANQAEPEDLIFGLIPELCYLTGLRDDLRSDFHVMREIATHTRVSPNQRVMALEKFCKNVNGNTAAKKILEDWGLQLVNTPQEMIARQFEEEQIYFAKNKVSAGPNADFGKYATSNQLIDVVHLQQWILIHCKNDARVARSFMDFLERNAGPMGVKVQRPTVITLQSDRIEAFVNALRENIRQGVQMVVCICPNSRDDRYAAIKKICCAEMPVPSQVINARTLSNDAKNRSIVQKIALQMNCKMGGTLWSLHIPIKSVMICGIDSYHDPSGKNNSTAAFVASINPKFTRWYSKAVIQTSREEIVNGLCSSLINALKVYEKENNSLPDKIIIYRDGVGMGQFNVVLNYEIPQFDSACQLGFKNYKAKITFVVVQKRIRTRFFNAERDLSNPQPGTVLDHTVTQRYLYDFFLVSQMVRQGTVTPTHYVVLRDDSEFTPDILQRLSYKLCYMYYNWPGTVRVPACCQYAHKLASLVGESLRRCNAEELADKLFYL